MRGASPAAIHAFTLLRDGVMSEVLADDPTSARDLGLHEYDGKVAPISRDAIAARVERLSKAADDLAGVDRAALSDDEMLDIAELDCQLRTSLFWLVDLDAPRKYPQFYEPLFSVNPFIDRDYAPLDERAKRLLAHEEAALGEVGHIRENLAPPLSAPVADVAARNFSGFATYLRGDVAKVMGKVGDDAQRARFAHANEALAAAASDLAGWLRKEAVHGDQSHVLGIDRYAKLLRVQEGLTLPLTEFERMNEDDLAANKKAYEALARAVKDKPVKETGYFATAEHMMKDARTFVIAHRIVSLASDDEATVRETPPYKRWNAASIEMSGPFESVKSAFYYLTIPDRSWPNKEREAYLGTVGDLLGTTIHEVYPGHFVQGRWQERAPTRAQKAFGDYAFVEGWAHYTEQMMVEEGFGKDDPGSELAMRRGALLRNCRFAASVGIHTKGMTVEQAAKRFVDDCHQDAPTAREQAVRGTFDPGYFAYTLGKLQIIALRDDAKRKLGDKFSLQRFHDALLSHGAPPIALVRDRVLREIGAGNGPLPKSRE
ncbi:MAG TPA: DUF885 domain-containing protein [Polyangiaceae bacterium]|nr:DUF885 domain-containing protein [Polyangiaceae bacterium]